MNETEYGAFLNFEWKLFDGFERDNALHEATSLRGAAEADLAALELRAIREVWKAYADMKTALRKREFALALLTASEEAYESTLESYRTSGLATVLDLLAAQRDLARARTTEIQSRTELLTTSAALTFATGDRRRAPGLRILVCGLKRRAVDDERLAVPVECRPDYIAVEPRMNSSGIPFGHIASHSPWFEQLPKPRGAWRAPCSASPLATLRP
jgi:hypothetical protein